MDILAIDDERLALDALVDSIRQAAPDALIHALRDPHQAVLLARSVSLDVAFVDIQMRAVNGLELALMLKRVLPRINIVFVTGHSEYAVDAFSMRASGYLLKPATAQAVARELADLRNPRQLPPCHGKLRIQTFGNFEVFAGDEPLHFGRSKAKELLAYLVDRRGAACTMAEIASVLWDDLPYDRSRLNQLHTFIAELKKVLSQAGFDGVLVKSRNSVAINTDVVDCDYYHLLDGDLRYVHSFANEYIANYSWAEFTLGSICRAVEQA